MIEIKIQPAAEQDLIEIWLYTLKQWGEKQADQYLDELDSGIQTIAEIPSVGVDYSHVREGYRRYCVKYHRIYYQFNNDAIEIVRILHEEMDDVRHL